MSDTVLDYQWSRWTDEVGETFAKKIQTELDGLDSPCRQYQKCQQEAINVLKQRPDYSSQKTLILSLEIV